MAFSRIMVYGTLSIGSPSCPIQSPLVFTVPGGNETYGARPRHRARAPPRAGRMRGPVSRHARPPPNAQLPSRAGAARLAVARRAAAAKR
jgi:hypothetical protein